MCIRDSFWTGNERHNHAEPVPVGPERYSGPVSYTHLDVYKRQVLVAAANPDLMEEYIEDGDIVIMGDRYESQLCALEMNAGLSLIHISLQKTQTV